MQRLGMLVDLSHVSAATMRGKIKPFIHIKDDYNMKNYSNR